MDMDAIEAEDTESLPKVPVEEQIEILFENEPDLLGETSGRTFHAINPWIDTTESLKIVERGKSLRWTLLSPESDIRSSVAHFAKPNWHIETLSVFDDGFDTMLRREPRVFDLCIFAAPSRQAPLILHRMRRRARAIAVLTHMNAISSTYVQTFKPSRIYEILNEQSTAWLIWD